MEPGGAFAAHEVELHGHRAVYRVAGDGPAVVLIHGMVTPPVTGRALQLVSPPPTG